jgi:hypothetical protein
MVTFWGHPPGGILRKPASAGASGRLSSWASGGSRPPRTLSAGKESDLTLIQDAAAAERGIASGLAGGKTQREIALPRLTRSPVPG